MSYKSVLTVWDGQPESRPALDLATDIVRQSGGHLNALCLGIDRIQPGLYYAGATPALMTDGLEAAREDAMASHADLEKTMVGSDIAWSGQAMVAQMSGLGHVVGMTARFNDLVVLPRPYGPDRSEDAAAIVEAAMFQGHVPVLICPNETKALPGKRIVIAWNESAEAMAAIRAALPPISEADAVDIAIIEPRVHDEDQSDPGAELSKMLARHGAKVTVSVLAKTVPRVAEVILRHASDFNADLIVMGAYGHSRFRESILGGATRDMLESASIPVLMAH